MEKITKVELGGFEIQTNVGRQPVPVLDDAGLAFLHQISARWEKNWNEAKAKGLDPDTCVSAIAISAKMLEETSPDLRLSTSQPHVVEIVFDKEENNRGHKGQVINNLTFD